MSMMNAELYDALLDAGAGEEKTRAASQAVGDFSQLATKEDVGALREDMSALQGELRSEVARLEGKVGLIAWMLGFNLVVTVGVLPALIVR